MNFFFAIFTESMLCSRDVCLHSPALPVLSGTGRVALHLLKMGDWGAIATDKDSGYAITNKDQSFDAQLRIMDLLYYTEVPRRSGTRTCFSSM